MTSSNAYYYTKVMSELFLQTSSDGRVSFQSIGSMADFWVVSTTTGGAIPSWQIRTVKLIRYVSAWDFFIVACEIVFCVFIFYYVVEEILELRIHKLQYFTSIWNILDVVVILLSIVAIGFHIFRTIEVNRLLGELLKHPNTYADFEFLAFWQTQYNNMNAVNLFFAWIKIFKYISFNKTMTQLSSTLARCAKDILGFAIMFFIVFFAYAQLGYLLFGTQVENFSTFVKCILGHADHEITAAFSRFDRDGNRILDEEEQQQMKHDLEAKRVALNTEIENLGKSYSENTLDENLTYVEARNNHTNKASWVSEEEFQVLLQRVLQLEQSINSIGSKIDAVVSKLDVLERNNLKRKDLDSVSKMGTAQNNSDLKKLHAVELDLCNKDMMADTFDHSVISVGEEEGVGNFQRSLPTRESLRSPRGSVVSFHNIQYSVKQSSGFLCKRKTVEKKILHNVYCIGGSEDGQWEDEDDVVMGTMTVRENLHFSAALRLPSSISVKEKEERVTQIISELGLNKVADAKVSGYECEPFNNPADFFLDIINGDSTAVAASKEDHRPVDTGKASKVAEHVDGPCLKAGFVGSHKPYIVFLAQSHQYTSGYYRVSAYFLALMIGDLLPMRTAPAIIFSCITYWMIGYQAVAGRFFFFMLTLIMVSYTATAMSLAISAGMDVVAVANLLITICFVLMLVSMSGCGGSLGGGEEAAEMG
ncbi:polycystic kidney disease 2-like 1 hypothetical protein [Limosa lapponica baueri]|uniref:EF-hand domain-containing protein n=1 Tax=Limosa lapponica baueri TaxID=1758121 RepID=A0A2I0TJJ5_LIMLA|nr:polycystic kidney disease 2-like 1 hypothetical protein [Limosa lapponica baueri]